MGPQSGGTLMGLHDETFREAEAVLNPTRSASERTEAGLRVGPIGFLLPSPSPGDLNREPIPGYPDLAVANDNRVLATTPRKLTTIFRRNT